MLRNHRRSLSLENRNRGHLDIPLVLLTATLVIFGLIAVANATMPLAVHTRKRRGKPARLRTTPAKATTSTKQPAKDWHTKGEKTRPFETG